MLPSLKLEHVFDGGVGIVRFRGRVDLNAHVAAGSVEIFQGFDILVGLHGVRGLTRLQVDEFAQFFDAETCPVAGELDLAEFVLAAGVTGKVTSTEGFFRRFLHNLGLGPCDRSFEIAVLRKDGKEILLGLKR